MNVGSYLEVYTTMFGWSVYNTLYELFNVTGLLYLPFLMAIYKNWRDPYLSQGDKPAALSSQQRMTWGIVSMVIIFSLAVLPFQPLALDEITYRVTCTDPDTGAINTPTNVTGGATGTTYDTALGGTADTRIPIIWWLTLSISSGVNAATNQSFKCFEDIKGLDQQLRNLTLLDPGLRQEYYNFANQCFLPAKSKFRDALRGGNLHDYVSTSLTNWLALNPDYDSTDPYYIGSHFFTETSGFYSQWDKSVDCTTMAGGCGFQAREAVSGWPYVEARDNYSAADIANGTAGRPFCDEWWTDGNIGLKHKLITSIEASTQTIPDWDSTLTAYENIVNTLTGIYQDTVYTADQLDDLVIGRYVQADPPVMTGLNNTQANGESSASDTFLGGAVGAGTATFAAIVAPEAVAAVGGALLATGADIAKQFGGFYTMMFVIKSAAPMLQAVLLMMIYIMLLIYLIVSEYEVDSVITVIFLMLAIRFFTPLWAMADYLDDRLFLAMYPDATWLGSGITLGFERLLLDMVLTILYIVAPMLLLYLMNMAGQNISRMGAAGMESGAIGGVGKGVGGSMKTGGRGK